LADPFEAPIDSEQEIGAQAGGAQFVQSAASSMSASAAGRTMKDGALPATLQARVKTGPNYLPRFPSIGMLLEIFQAPIELCPLIVGKGDLV
jgi:hypothetical protein